MKIKMLRKILAISLLFTFIFTTSGFCASQAAEYLCELGINFYRMGRYEDALLEFKKALMLDNDAPTAKKYIALIFKEEIGETAKPAPAAAKQPVPAAKQAVSNFKPATRVPQKAKTKKGLTRDDLISQTLSGIDRGAAASKPIKIKKERTSPPPAQPAVKQPAPKPEKSAAKKLAAKKPAPEKPMPEKPAPPEESPIAEKPATRDELINQSITDLAKKSPPAKKEKSPAVLSGEYRLSMGATSKDIIWKDANADRIDMPHDKNWRYIWGDQRQNTYDPKIYDRLKVNMETKYDNPFNGGMEINFDPWTFVGKNRVTIPASGGAETVDMDLKYWSADNRTINETYRSSKGKILNLKQIKVTKGNTTVSGITIAPTNAQFGEIAPMDLKREYRPIRKFWMDYKQGDLAVKFFPLSDEFEALTSDDPLRISNNHAYWEETPWLDAYEPSNTFAPDTAPLDITRLKGGKWVRRLSYFTKDSSDDYPHRLTFLRGLSFKADPGSYSLEATVATPLSLWDDYERTNSVHGGVKFKLPMGDSLELGLTSASKLGLNGGSIEAVNQVQAIDLGYNLSDYLKLYAEIAESHTEIQQVLGFKSNYDGIGAKLGFNYDASDEKKSGIYKAGIYAANMDNNFYPALSNYRYTRSDADIFARHIFFSEIKEEDKALVWGDGIDRARKVLGFGLSSRNFNEKLDTNINYRNVHQDSGKYIESVMRLDSTYKATPKLTGKALAYYQNLHKTHANQDPIIYNKTMYSSTDYLADDDNHPTNSTVLDDKDPSVGAFGIGAKYDLRDDLSLEGIYERTNDPLNFPRGILNDLSVSSETRDGTVWDKINPFLYDQSFFGSPPYNYYNIAKTKLRYVPQKELEFILSYTFNENKHATGIDDNINHVGLETTYKPTDKLSFWLKYVYSKVIDIYKQNLYQSDGFYEGHHNFFFGSEYSLGKDSSFTLLYGEFMGYNDPYQQSNWTLSTLDTQHILRLFYRRKF